MGGQIYELELFWIISGGLTGILLDFCDLHFKKLTWLAFIEDLFSFLSVEEDEGRREIIGLRLRTVVIFNLFVN